ncbi:MAG: acyltransferase family protein [Marinobacter sp.]|uniref:acyltransferase family protein n=1 Tax=Marinobacter sp. TaxID=50741 RepID=UPI0032D9205F
MSAASFRADIQGLRAIAVLAVMAFHYNPAWLPGGFVGVDVFLVISGFLITTILLNRKSKADYSLYPTLKYFYVSRFKRIAPAYFAMLILVALVAAVLYLPKDFDTFKDGLDKAAWFTSNHYFAEFGDYFAPANSEQPLLHTWSLAVEMQFYLLAPFLILFLSVNALKAVFVTLLVGLTLIAEYRLRIQGIEQATYYSLYARLPEFFAGGLAALFLKPAPERGLRCCTTLGIGLIAFAVVAQPELGAFPGFAALLPVVGSILLLSQPAGGLSALFLCSRTLVWIGALSYSLYLWHWPVLAFLRYYSGAEVLDATLSFVFLVSTLSLSVLSYYGVERVFRGKPAGRGQSLRWGVLASATLATSQAMATVNEVFIPKQLPIEYRRYADPASICHGTIVGDCLRGDLSSNREVLVLGDSHAAMLNHFFDYIGKEAGFKARIITASGCVTIPNFDYLRIPEWVQQPCKNQIEAVLPQIEKNRSIFVAALWSRHTSSEAFNTVFEDFLSRQNGKEIFILSQVPQFTHDVNRIQRFSAIGLPTDWEKVQSYRVANGALAKLASKHENVEFLKLDTLPVFSEAPFLKGEVIYSDDHHLNEVGAAAYAKSALLNTDMQWFSPNL